MIAGGKVRSSIAYDGDMIPVTVDGEGEGSEASVFW